MSGANWGAYWATEDTVTSPAEELVQSMRSTRSKVNLHALPHTTSCSFLPQDRCSCHTARTIVFRVVLGMLPCFTNAPLHPVPYNAFSHSGSIKG